MIPVSSRSYRIYKKLKKELKESIAGAPDVSGAEPKPDLPVVFRKNAERFSREYREHHIPYLAMPMQIWAEGGEKMFAPDYWCYCLLVYALDPKHTDPAGLIAAYTPEQLLEPVPESLRQNVYAALQRLWLRYLDDTDRKDGADSAEGAGDTGSAEEEKPAPRIVGGRSVGAGHTQKMREQFRALQAEELSGLREAIVQKLEAELAEQREQRVQELTAELSEKREAAVQALETELAEQREAAVQALTAELSEQRETAVQALEAELAELRKQQITGGKSIGAGHMQKMRERFRALQAEEFSNLRESAVQELETELLALREQRIQELTEELAAEKEKALAIQTEQIRETAEYALHRAEYDEYLAEVRQMAENRPLFFNGLMQQLGENSRAFRQAGDEAAAAMREACEQAVERLKLQTENAINSVVQVQFKMSREDGQALPELYTELEETLYYSTLKNEQEPWFADYQKELTKLLHKLQKAAGAVGYTRFFCGAGDAYDPDSMVLFDEESPEAVVPQSGEENAALEVALCVTSGFMQGDVLSHKARVILRRKAELNL